MIRRLLKKYLPTKEQLQKHQYLRIFGRLIQGSNLWHLNSRSVSRAFACGLFAGFMPMPFQMVLGAALAIIFRANLAISIALVWFSNPLTMPPIFYFAYKVGKWILDSPIHNVSFELSLSWFQTQFLHIWKPLLVGSLACGIVSAILGYFIVRVSFWLYHFRNKL